MTQTREQAWALLCEWVSEEPLRRHCLAVEAAMRGQARLRDADEELWGMTGLLHDLDYERYPDLETGHPRHAMTELRALGYPEEMIRAIGSHAEYLGISRESEMERCLAAVDELSGFVLACARVRPTGIHGLTPKSVKKKLREPSFAAAVSREDVSATAAALGVDFDEHLRNVIAALELEAAALGVEGQAQAG
jgi:putative nucleotidyltransferase with HDIG domain